MGFIILLVVVVVAAAIVSYNKLIRLQQNISEAKSSIEVQMKRKANIITNLVDAVRQQGEFEKSTLEKLTAARSGLLGDNFDEKMKADISASNLFKMVEEAYPSLGTNEGYKELMEGIRDCEDKVSYSRNRYNVAVVTYNTAQKTFPTMLFAGLAKCKEEKVYEMNAEEFVATDNLRISKL